MVELTVQQTSKMLECSESTIRRMEETGELPSINGDGQRKFDLYKVLSLMGHKMPIKFKASVYDVKISNIKDALKDFQDNDIVELIIEEYPHPSLRTLSIRSEKLMVQHSI